MPPGASRCCPCTTPSPTTAAFSPSRRRTAAHPAVGAGCSCRDPRCGQVGKHPLGSLVPHGLKDATTNRARMLAWWTHQPQANIGLATGHRFDVLDVDGPTGAQAIRDLRRPASPGELGAAGPDRRRRMALLLGSDRAGQRPSPRPRAGGLAGPWRLCRRPTQPPPLGHPYTWVAGRDLDTAVPGVPAALLQRLQHRQAPTDPPGHLPPGGRRPRTSLWAGGPRPRTGPGRHRPPRPAQPPLWEPTRNLYNLVATGTLDHHQVHHGLLQAADRCGLLD